MQHVFQEVVVAVGVDLVEVAGRDPVVLHCLVLYVVVVKGVFRRVIHYAPHFRLSVLLSLDAEHLFQFFVFGVLKQLVEGNLQVLELVLD